MNIFYHIFNSAKQHITMFEWINEYITCLCIINNIQRFFTSNNQPGLLILTKLWLHLLVNSSTSSFKKIKLIIFLKIHFSTFYLYLPYIIKFPCNIFADVFSNYSSSTAFSKSCINLVQIFFWIFLFIIPLLTYLHFLIFLWALQDKSISLV